MLFKNFKMVSRLVEAGQRLTKWDMQSAVDARQRLESQQAENKAVQKEFSGLDDEATIYRLVGPVLVKQERADAEGTVNGRLRFIGEEIDRTEARIKEIQDNTEKKRVEVIQLQQKMQAAQAGWMEDWLNRNKI